jgi:hypothetical protein
MQDLSYSAANRYLIKERSGASYCSVSIREAFLKFNNKNISFSTFYKFSNIL